MKPETFEQRIRHLEEMAQVRVSGTTIQRVLMDLAVLEREGIASRQRRLKVCANPACSKPWKGDRRQCLCAFQGMALWREVAEDGGPLRQSEAVWSVGIGEQQAPKVYGYGHTISEALSNVEQKLKELVKTRRSAP